MNSYQLVFSGDLAFDADEEQVRTSLEQQCKFTPETVNRLLAGRRVILKKGLSEPKANQYKSFFDQLGLLCDVVPEQPAEPLQAQRQPDTVVAQKPKGRTCPKCSASHQQGDSCQQCGIIFARFEAAQARPSHHFIQEDAEADSPQQQLESWLPKLRQIFIVQVLLLILPVLLLRGPLHNIYPLALVLLIVGVIVFFLFQASETGESVGDLCAEYVDIRREQLVDRKIGKFDLPPATAALVSGQLLIFYLLKLIVPLATLQQKLAFLPAQPTFFNGLLAALAAPFLHAGAGQLWINLTFLWLVAAAVEHRFGLKKLLLLYLPLALLSQLCYLLLALCFGHTPQLLGAEAVICGLLGFLSGSGETDRLEAPLPLLSMLPPLFSYRLRIDVKILVLVGLYFLIGSGGDSNLQPTAAVLGLFYPLCGLLVGVALGYVGRVFWPDKEELG